MSRSSESVIKEFAFRFRDYKEAQWLSGRDRGATDLSPTHVTALWLQTLSKTHLSKLSTGSTQEDPSLFN